MSRAKFPGRHEKDWERQKDIISTASTQKGFFEQLLGTLLNEGCEDVTPEEKDGTCADKGTAQDSEAPGDPVTTNLVGLSRSSSLDSVESWTSRDGEVIKLKTCFVNAGVPVHRDKHSLPAEKGPSPETTQPIPEGESQAACERAQTSSGTNSDPKFKQGSRKERQLKAGDVYAKNDALGPNCPSPGNADISLSTANVEKEHTTPKAKASWLFTLPERSSRSSRKITPNRKFLDSFDSSSKPGKGNDNRPKPCKREIQVVNHELTNGRIDDIKPSADSKNVATPVDCGTISCASEKTVYDERMNCELKFEDCVHVNNNKKLDVPMPLKPLYLKTSKDKTSAVTQLERKKTRSMNSAIDEKHLTSKGAPGISGSGLPLKTPNEHKSPSGSESVSEPPPKKLRPLPASALSPKEPSPTGSDSEPRALRSCTKPLVKSSSSEAMLTQNVQVLEVRTKKCSVLLENSLTSSPEESGCDADPKSNKQSCQRRGRSSVDPSTKIVPVTASQKITTFKVVEHCEDLSEVREEKDLVYTELGKTSEQVMSFGSEEVANKNNNRRVSTRLKISKTEDVNSPTPQFEKVDNTPVLNSALVVAKVTIPPELERLFIAASPQLDGVKSSSTTGISESELSAFECAVPGKSVDVSEKLKAATYRKIQNRSNEFFEVNGKLLPRVVRQKLPGGWLKKYVKRPYSDKHKWDVYLVSNQGKKLRSTVELKKYLEETGTPVSPSVNFSISPKILKIQELYDQAQAGLLIASVKKVANPRTKDANGETNCQQQQVKGPRVKHVCRSAQVVFGLPRATFPETGDPIVGTEALSSEARLTSEASNPTDAGTSQRCGVCRGCRLVECKRCPRDDVNRKKTCPHRRCVKKVRRKFVQSEIPKNVHGSLDESHLSSGEEPDLEKKGQDSPDPPASAAPTRLLRKVSHEQLEQIDKLHNNNSLPPATAPLGSEDIPCQGAIYPLRSVSPKKVFEETKSLARYPERLVQPKVSGRKPTSLPSLSREERQKEKHVAVCAKVAANIAGSVLPVSTGKPLMVNPGLAVDFWEQYDISSVWEQGFALIGAELPLNVELCYLCGSAGIEELIYCSSCCEPFHPYCLIDQLDFPDAHGCRCCNPALSTQLLMQLTQRDWICKRCTHCVKCGESGGDKMRCQLCGDSYHIGCSDIGKNQRDFQWSCPQCCRCKSCGTPGAKHHVGNRLLCTVCYRLHQKGNFCPICEQCYQDDDFVSKMMECGICQSWVHAHCEKISDDHYQILSFMPESAVEYTCRRCSPTTDRAWVRAIEEFQLHGFQSVLTTLSRTKGIRELFESPLSSESELPATTLSFLNPNGPDLTSLKEKLYRGRPVSVSDFFLELKTSLSKATTCDDKKSHLLTVLQKSVRATFPWFDHISAEICPSDSIVPYKSASPSPKKKPYRAPFDIPLDNVKAPGAYDVRLDTRRCALCQQQGESAPYDRGRVLYCGQNEWVHVNCALWSNEVYEEIDGSLQNVHSAIARVKQLKCAVCSQRGASVGCCARGCGTIYHFHCARSCGSTFLEDKSVYCYSHRELTTRRPKQLCFEVRRCVYVDLESERKKFKPVNSLQLRLSIGSLKVQSFGILQDISAAFGYLVPVLFKSQRVYWSTRNPTKKVVYTCQTYLSQPIEDPSATENNHTISHDDSSPAKVSALSIDDLGESDVIQTLLNELESENLLSDHQDLRLRSCEKNPEFDEYKYFEELLGRSNDCQVNQTEITEIVKSLQAYEEQVELNQSQEMKSVKRNLSSYLTATPPKTPRYDETVSKPSRSSPEKPLLGNRIRILEKSKLPKKLIRAAPKVGFPHEGILKDWGELIPQLDGCWDSDSDDDMPYNLVNGRAYLSEDAAPEPEISVSYCNPTVPTHCQPAENHSGQGEADQDADDESEEMESDNSNSSYDSSDEPCDELIKLMHDESYEIIPQVDGTMDSADPTPAPAVSNSPPRAVRTDDGLVKCSKCKRVYRTLESYEKHVSVCNYEILTSDSDGETDDQLVKKEEIKEEETSYQYLTVPKEEPNLETAISDLERLLPPSPTKTAKGASVAGSKKSPAKKKRAPRGNGSRQFKQEHMLLSQLVNQYGTPQSLQVIQQNVQPAVQQFFHPQQLVQQVVQGQTMMLQQPMMQQIPVMQQPTIIQTGITQNGQPIYMMSQNRQAQVMQPMVPIPQPGGGVLQYLGTFPTSALPTLSDYMTAGSLGVSQNQPSQQAITTYILQADGTLIQVQPQPAFQNLAPQQNIIYNQPQIQTIYQPQAPLPSASQGQTSVAMSPSVSQPQSFTMSNSFSNPMADVSATCSTPYQQSIPCSSQYQQSVAYQAQPAPTSTPYAALGTTSYQHSMPVLSSTPNSQAVIRPRFPQPYEVPRPKMSQSRPEVHKRPMPTAANYHRSQQFTHIAGKQGARTPFPQNPQFDNFQDNGAQSPFPYKQDSIHTHQFPVCDKASTSHLTKQASACPSPDLLQRALVESSTFSDAFDDFFSEEPQGIQHASFHASVQMENTLPPLKDYFEEISDTRELSAPEPIKPPVESLTNSPSSRQATPPVLPSPSPCDNLVSSSCPDTADTPTPAVSQPSTPSTSQIPTPEPHHSNIKAPRPSFSYRDFAAKAKTEVQDSKVSPGKSNDKPSYKVVVQRTEKQGYEVSAADSSTGDKPLETLKEEKKATKEKTPTPTESRTKSFQVKAKLVVPAGSSAKMFTDADKKLVAPIVENFAKRLAQVPTFDTSAVEKTQAAPPPKGPHIVYEVTSADGFFCRSHDINEVWQQVLFAVQEARRAHNIPPIPENEKKNKNGMQLLGLSHNALQYLVEQLPGAKKCTDHNFKYHHPEKEESLVESKNGCARAQAYSNRNPHDMFGWLASQHRPKPSAPPQCLVEEAQATITRRVTATQSSDLPMSMRYRQLRKTAKDTVGVFRSPIHGRGLFCKRDVEPGEMVIEYAGEVIRSSVTDVREKLYEAKGIGCYMFRIDDEIVVDATMHGNAARFINHSCDPNCFSKIVDVYGKKHIIIFALRKIYRGEELTYNYKFPIEDDKIPCSCQAKRCRKYLN